METKEWCSKYYNFPSEDFVEYNSGICYSTVWVKSKESAIKVSESVKGRTVNGGMFDGMPLGAIREGNDGVFSVTC